MTPQSAIIPDHCTASLFLEADIFPDRMADIKTACRQAVDVLTGWQSRHSGQQIGMTVAFGADCWQQFGHRGEGSELKAFTPMGNGLCPATQSSLMIHIQSLNAGINYLLAQQILALFGDSLTVTDETHGFRLPEERGLDGFVDGTENPQNEEDIRRIGTITEGPDSGGSYVLLQQYLHNLKQWNSISLSEQEACIGRSKADNREFPRAERLSNSHLNRTNIKENGIGLKIVRRSMPFGRVSGEHGLQFIAYCARLYNIEQQLLNMFGDADGQTDLLLQHLSRVKRSAYYYAPSVERLQNL